MQPCKTGDQPYSDASPNGECSLASTKVLHGRALKCTFACSKELAVEMLPWQNLEPSVWPATAAEEPMRRTLQSTSKPHAAAGPWSNRIMLWKGVVHSVTRKKLPNVYKSYPKMSSVEKW